MRFPRSRLVAGAALTAAALLLGARAARAQAVRVTAVEAGTGAPIANALLTAADTLGQPVANVATGVGGPRLLRLPGPGTYRVSLRRIGQRPYAAPALTVGPRDTAVLALRVPAQPVLLTTVRVHGEAACGRAEDPAVAALWDQIRTAVTLVALQDDSADAPRPDVRRYALRLGPDAHTALAHTVLLPERGRPRPFGNFAPESLSAFGYVRRAGRNTLYMTPDEAVLLSPGFAADHCFGSVAGQGPERGLVGLSFAPVRTRHVPEVAGVLWADSATAALRYLEFWYADDELPPAVRGPGFADGEVHFATLPDGHWAMTAWRLRVPQRAATATDAARTYATSRGIRIRIDGGSGDGPWQFVEVGAVASNPADTGRAAGAVTGSVALGRLVARVRAGRAAVRVQDAAGRALAGASVQVTQEPDSAAAGYEIDDAGARLTRGHLVPARLTVATDATGRALVPSLPPGRYRAHVEHPALDSAGVQPPEPAFVVESADSAAGVPGVTIAPRTLADLDARCPRRERGDTAAARIVYGVVADETAPAVRAGAVPPPAARARVTVRWDVPGGPHGQRRVGTDDAGAFVACGVPRAATISVAAEGAHGDGVAPPRLVAVGGWRAVFAALALQPAGEARRGGPPRMVVAGTVVDSVAGMPLPGALVQIVDAAHPELAPFGATTDSAGAFRMADVPPGRYYVAFSHPLLDAYGLSPDAGFSELRPEWTAARLTLAVPGPARVRTVACARTPALGGAGSGLLVGWVRDTLPDHFVDRGRVRASWAGDAPSLSLTMEADIVGGVYRLCGVPAGARVTLAAELPDGRGSAPVDVVVPPAGVAARDLVVRRR